VAADGREFVLAAVEDRFWTGVAKVFALDPDWLDLGHAARQDRADELNRAVRDQALTASAAHWVALLQAEGVPASPVRTPAEALAASDPGGTLRVEPSGRVGLRFPARGIGIDLPAAP
jgi:crotonobetainyl-CoA:carnitine CoA-transferase CaiB-like acyl-CoA transferase